MVPDADGTGHHAAHRARAGPLLRPASGPGSRAAHEAAGHVVLADVGAGLRRDVDTTADLAAAVGLGVGPATAAALAALAPFD